MSTTATELDRRRIYVACLAAYNNGKLHGEWLDLDDYADADAVHTAIRYMLDLSPEHDPFGLYGPAEEWAIHDHEGFEVQVGEYDDIDRLMALNDGLNEHGEALAAYMEAHSLTDPGQYDATKLVGCYDHAKDWAEEATDSLIEHLRGAVRIWARDQPRPEAHVNWRDIQYAVDIDLEEIVTVAETNWGYQFVEHGNSVYVFTN